MPLTDVPAPDREVHEPPLRVLLGAVLRSHRERQGRTLRDVAGAAQVSLPYLSEVERGRKEPSSEVLAAVCRALGLRLVDLVAGVHRHLDVPGSVGVGGPAVVELTSAPVVDLAARRAPADRRLAPARSTGQVRLAA